MSDAVYYPAPTVDMRVLVSDGSMFDLMRPTVDGVSLAVIARALSHICRYGGHVRRFYSVAEHSKRLADWFADGRSGSAAPLLLARYALVHDAAEAYVGDLVRPLKRALPYHEHVERVVQRQIFKRLGLDPEIPAEVLAADTRIIRDEIAVLIPDAVWQGPPGVEALGVPVVGVSPQIAYAGFMAAGASLFGEAWR